jgi:predicted ATPase
MQAPLADVLRHYMQRSAAPYTPGLLSKFSGIPKATIVNWLDGQVARPRRWQDLVRVADVLRLNEHDVDMLLRSAGHPSIATLLQEELSEVDRHLLRPWFKNTAPLLPPPVRPSLPAVATPFIGRVQLLATTSALLQRPDLRLLTLTGPAGTGKTRLALQVASQLQHFFVDGVYFVDLASLDDAQLVPNVIAQALSVPEGNGPILLTLTRYLQGRQLLLLLDNFEHVVAASTIIAALLAAAPGLNVLVTSRILLRLYGEHEIVIPPMALPDVHRLPQLDQLQQYEAVELFVQRAQMVEPGFALTEENKHLISAICQRLDGLPLAIELAAARIKLLSAQTLLERLADRLGLLTWGARNLPRRHQTLRATLDWSYGLLNTATQRLFAQLAIFRGGCTIDAAEAIYDSLHSANELAPQTILDGLMTLADNSLLFQVAGADGVQRYMMLDTMHEYARERLAQSGLAAALWPRYANYYLTFARMAEPLLGGSDQAYWLARLESEQGNFRHIFEWALQHKEAELAAQLGGALWEFWRIRGFLHEGRAWLEMALAQHEALQPATQAKAYLAAGRLAREQGALTAASAHLTRSLALQRILANQAGIANVLGHLGVVAYDQGDFARAEELHSESLALRRAIGDLRGEAGTLTNLGEVARHQGNYQASMIYHQQSLTLFQQLGDPWGIALAQGNIGTLAYKLGDYDYALTAFRESLTRCSSIDYRDGIAAALEGIASTDAIQGRAQRAALLSGAAEQIRAQIGAPLPAVDNAAYQQCLQQARVTLGEHGFNQEYERGHTMLIEQIIKLVQVAE